MKDKIFVYQRSMNGVLHLIEEYDSPTEFRIHNYSEGYVKGAFRNDTAERVVEYDVVEYDYGRRKASILNQKVYAKVAFNSSGKIIPVTQLVGYVRDREGILIVNRGHYKGWDEYWMQTRQGRKASAIGSYRRPHSTQEKRWVNAWDDEEDCPPVRASRNLRHLPDAWDDHWGRGQKSWKKQSKRKHQWREK